MGHVSIIYNKGKIGGNGAGEMSEKQDHNMQQTRSASSSKIPSKRRKQETLTPNIRTSGADFVVRTSIRAGGRHLGLQRRAVERSFRHNLALQPKRPPCPLTPCTARPRTPPRRGRPSWARRGSTRPALRTHAGVSAQPGQSARGPGSRRRHAP